MSRAGGVPVDHALSVQDTLRRYRLAAGLSQEALAERAGLSVDAIGAIERGLRRPRSATLRAIAAALDLSPLQVGTLEATLRRTGRPHPAPVPPGVSVAPNALLGRAHDLAVVAYLLRVAGVRLLTLTGPGGVGKTRLAAQAAIEAAEVFPHGVVWVDLAALRAGSLVDTTVARRVGVRERSATPREDLTAALRETRTLLMLDNCEHLPAVRDLVAALLAACPRLAIVATSRAALRLAGEQEYVVPPLGLPGSGEESVEAVERAPATALFLQRARAMAPGLMLGAALAPAVAAICRRLDGLPLAIELAATLVHVLPPGALLARLEGAVGDGRTDGRTDGQPAGDPSSSLDVLAVGAWTLPDRQQTLRAAIAWSHDLLAGDEQILFRRLAVFAGGWTLEAGAALVPEVTEDTATLLNALAHQSLVRRDDGAAGAAGAPRYGMLETIRAYAWERLDASGEAAASRARHAAYYLTLAEQAEETLHGPEQRLWLTRLAREHDNLRAVLQWARDQGEVTLGLRIVGALQRYWELHGHLREALGWLESLVPAAAETATDTAVRAKALHTGGILAHRLAEYPLAERWLDQSLALYRELGDTRGVAQALNNLGNVALAGGDAARAAGHYDQSVSFYRAAGYLGGVASALNNLAEAHRHQGQDVEAEALYTQSLALYQEIEDTWSIASVLNNLGSIALDRGDAERASSLYERSLALRQELGNGPGIALVLSNLARVALARGDPRRATELYAQSLDLYREVESHVGMAQCFEGLAEVAGTQDQWARAVALSAAARALRDAINTPLTPLEHTAQVQILATARRQLGDDLFNEAEAAGQTWPLPQAIVAAKDVKGRGETGRRG